MDSQKIPADRLVYFGRKMALEGRVPLALEALGMGVQSDIVQGINIFDDVTCVETVSRVYEELGLQTRTWARLPGPDGHTPGKRTRIAYVQSNIIDATNAQTQRLLGLLRNHDTERFEVRVYSTEDFAKRPYPLLWVHQAMPSSTERGAGAIKECAARGMPVYVPSVHGTLLDTAYELGHEIANFDPDVVVYQGSPACPLQCLLACWRLAPKQVNINVGVPMYLRGIDVTTCVSQFEVDRFTASWEQAKGTLAHINTGIDMSADVGEPDVEIPDRKKDEVVIMTVGNQLDRRVMPEFQNIIMRVLQENPNAVYYIVGGGNFGAQMQLFQKAQVTRQVGFLGASQKVRAVLKHADIYVNEFPIGGAQSVMEAMAEGLPVVATHYSAKHQHCCGANYVGDEAVAPYTPQAYYEKLTALVRDAELRQATGAKLLAKVRAEHDYAVVTKQYEELYLDAT